MSGLTLDDAVRSAVRAALDEKLEDLREMVREELRAALGSKPTAAEWMSVEQVAKLCHAEPKTVRSWIGAGKLKAKKAGQRYVVALADLHRFLDGTEVTAAPDDDAQISKIIGSIGGRKERTRG